MSTTKYCLIGGLVGVFIVSGFALTIGSILFLAGAFFFNDTGASVSQIFVEVFLPAFTDVPYEIWVAVIALGLLVGYIYGKIKNRNRTMV